MHERPAWIIPAAVAAGVLILSGFFLYYYFGPTTKELLGLDPRASIDDAPVEAIVADRQELQELRRRLIGTRERLQGNGHDD